MYDLIKTYTILQRREHYLQTATTKKPTAQGANLFSGKSASNISKWKTHLFSQWQQL